MGGGLYLCVDPPRLDRIRIAAGLPDLPGQHVDAGQGPFASHPGPGVHFDPVRPDDGLGSRRVPGDDDPAGIIRFRRLVISPAPLEIVRVLIV